MRWRDVLIGALITLFVTVVSGVILYYLTREPPQKSPSEALRYTVESGTSFRTQTTKVYFATVTVRNVGNAPASNVVIATTFPSSSRIADRNIAISSGPAGRFTERRKENQVSEIVVPILTPGESINLSFMLHGIESSRPSVGVKSDRTMGKEGSFLELTESEKGKPRVEESLYYIIPVAALLQLVLLLALKIIRRTYVHANNTAFLFLHQDLPDKAERILQRLIASRGGGAIELSNYALCCGLRGDHTLAMKVLAAAAFYARSKREKLLVKFNRAILLLKSGDVAAGVKEFDAAIEMDRSEMKRYYEYSSLVQAMVANIPDLARAIEKLRGTQQGGT